jgi:hypothetical protein
MQAIITNIKIRAAAPTSVSVTTIKLINTVLLQSHVPFPFIHCPRNQPAYHSKSQRKKKGSGWTGCDLLEENIVDPVEKYFFSCNRKDKKKQ